MGRTTLSAALIVIAAVAVAELCSIAHAASAAHVVPQVLGGWIPITDVNDPHIQELGSWAVAEHVRLVNDGLRFSKVVSGEEQVISGISYKLILQVTNRDGKDATYGAVVYEQEWTKKRKLVSFKPAN